MAARNTADSRRFVFRSSNREPEPYFVPVNSSKSNASQPLTLPSMHAPPKVIRSARVTTPPTEVATPARRIVVIRNTRNPQVEQGPADLDDFGRPNSLEGPPAISDGHKSVYLIRRPIAPPEPSSTTSLEYRRTLTPPQEIVTSTDPPRSPSPRHSPPIRPKSSKHPENSQRYAPYLRRPRSKPRTPSPVRTNSTHRSSPPSSPKQEEPTEIDHKRSFSTFYSIKNTNEPVSSPPPAIIENEQQLVPYHHGSTAKNTRRKKSTSSRAKSAKSVVLVNSDDQPVVVAENSHIREDPLKRPKSFKKTRFQDDIDDESTEQLVKRSRWQTCLGCLSRHMCLIIIICFIFILIGLAGVGVSAYFLATASSISLIPKIVGIAIGGVLVIAAFCFLYILLGCIGAREGYFTYDDEDSHVGGRAFALISPTHPNARLYIPRDYMKIIENSYPPPPTTTTAASNAVHNHLSLTTPVSTIPYTQQPVYRLNTATNDSTNKSNKNNITIEMPERFLSGRRMSPKTRERNLNKVVKNIGHIVEDAKKRYNGDVPTKVIVKVDNNAMQTD